MAGQTIVNSDVAERYATALFELAETAKKLDATEKDLHKLKAVFAGSDELRKMAASPLYSAEDKASALVAVAKKAKVSKLVSQFVGAAALNKRAADIPSIIDAFQVKLDRKRGSTRARVTSAKKLTAAQLKSIAAGLKTSLGRDVEIDTEVDPALLGGFVVKIGSRLFDSSLKTKLEGLKLAMKEV